MTVTLPTPTPRDAEDRSMATIEVNAEVVPWDDDHAFTTAPNGSRVTKNEIEMTVEDSELEKGDPIVSIYMFKEAGIHIPASALLGFAEAIRTSSERLLALLDRMGIHPEGHLMVAKTAAWNAAQAALRAAKETNAEQ